MWNPFRPPPPLHMSESFQYIYIYKKTGEKGLFIRLCGAGGRGTLSLNIFIKNLINVMSDACLYTSLTLSEHQFLLSEISHYIRNNCACCQLSWPHCISMYYKKSVAKQEEKNWNEQIRKKQYVTDANLTLNPDYQWTGGPGRSSGISTFSW